MGKSRKMESLWPIVYSGRRKSAKSSTITTISQKEHQAKFAAAVKFYHHVKSVNSMVTCKGEIPDSAAKLFWYIYDCGFTGTYPNYEIDYENFFLTAGDLVNRLWKVRWIRKGMIDIDWEYEIGKKFGCGEDELFVFIYNATTKRSFIFNSGAKRRHHYERIEVPGRDLRDKVHGWMFFKSKDNRRCSFSRYFKLDGDGSVIPPRVSKMAKFFKELEERSQKEQDDIWLGIE